MQRLIRNRRFVWDQRADELRRAIDGQMAERVTKIENELVDLLFRCCNLTAHGVLLASAMRAKADIRQRIGQEFTLTFDVASGAHAQ